MSSADPAAMPVVKLDRWKWEGKQYESVALDHVYQVHNGGYHLYHPAHPPWEVVSGNTGSETFNLTKKQARSLRDQLNAMDLDDPKEG